MPAPLKLLRFPTAPGISTYVTRPSFGLAGPPGGPLSLPLNILICAMYERTCCLTLHTVITLSP